MKLSVSLPDDDVATLDEYVRNAGLSSRSAAVQRAVRLLRQPELEQDYGAAWEQWEASGEESAWSVTTTDGDVDASR